MPSSNSVQTFPNFLSLPYEIRRLVYIASTDPRIVYVPLPTYEEDKEALDQFVKDFSSQIAVPPLYPDMAYFSKGWRDRAHRLSFQQRPLESFGFTTTKPLSKPWEPSAENPEIPLHALHEEPDIAFAVSRSCELRSNAEIPPFLHVSPESRQTLIDYGYSLAFGGRTSPPKVWFHFEHDTLYLDGTGDSRYREGPMLSTLCSTDWSLGLFRPLDLSKLRYVALAHPAPICIVDFWICARMLAVFDLLPGLRKLTIATFDQYELESFFPPQQTSTDSGKRARSIYSTRNLTKMPTVDVDAFMSSLPWTRDHDSRSLADEMVRYYRSRDEQDVTLFYVHQTSKLVRQFRNFETAFYADSSVNQYTTTVPAALEFSIICPSNVAPLVLAERRRTTDNLHQMRRNYRACVDKHQLSSIATTDYNQYYAYIQSNWAELMHALGEEQAHLPTCELHYYATVENEELLTQISPWEQGDEDVSF